MKRPRILNDASFWNILSYLSHLKDPQTITQMAQQLSVDQAEIRRALNFLEEIQMPIKTHNDQVIPGGPIPIIKMELTLLEWMALQMFFPQFAKECNTPFYRIISEKFSQVESEYKQHDLFKTLESIPMLKGKIDQSLISFFNSYLTKIEEAIIRQNILNISLSQGIHFLVYPHRIVHLEGKLKVVGEDAKDRCLTTFDVELIQELKVLDKTYTPNFSALEVNDFIAGFREVSGNEIRLILKIKLDDEFLDLSPAYHFLGDPYITTNSVGETIWAASIEPCDDLIHWLIELEDRVEILDPLDFKNRVEHLKSERFKKKVG